MGYAKLYKDWNNYEKGQLFYISEYKFRESMKMYRYGDTEDTMFEISFEDFKENFYII